MEVNDNSRRGDRDLPWAAKSSTTWLSRVLVFAFTFAVAMAVASSGAAAQTSLTEVKCSFFDDYAASGYDSAAGMPLAIATSGDELPRAVADAFGVIEAGEPTSLANQTAIAGFFGPLCNPGQAASSNAAAAVPPEQLASTGAARATTIIGLIGVMLLGLGVVLVQEYGGGVYAWSGLLATPTRSLPPRPIPQADPNGPVAPGRPIAAEATRRRFWLLTDEGE